MTTYRAVVKYPIDAEPKIKERELREGLGYILMELVSDHDYTLGKVESVMEDAQQEAEMELQMKEAREVDKDDED